MSGHRRVTLPWLAVLAVSLLVGAHAAAAQEPGDEIREDALRVFLDCNAFPCDSEYFRTEVGFVNWVRDRELAQIHLIITRNRTGGGGSVYSLDFVGREDLEGDDDELRLTTLSTDTEDEILMGLSRVIGAGLARYSAAIGQPDAYSITPAEAAPGPETDELVEADQVRDPWDFWVFEVGADVDLQGEESERERRYSGSFEARRTTALWKFELEADGIFRRDERELEDGEVVVDDRVNWDTDVLLVRTLADHWSQGIITGAGASTRRNQNFGANAAVALEYSFFPYVQAPRRSLTARYDVRMRYFEWDKETIFFRTEEVRPQQQLRVEFFQRQPWGEARVSVDGSQFLHDPSMWRVALDGDLELRIFRGLSLDVESDLDFIEDQLFISREGLTEEEILLGRFDRPTDMSYNLELGLSFEFGSIFNNVVNNRFD